MVFAAAILHHFKFSNDNKDNLRINNKDCVLSLSHTAKSSTLPSYTLKSLFGKSAIVHVNYSNFSQIDFWFSGVLL